MAKKKSPMDVKRLDRYYPVRDVLQNLEMVPWALEQLREFRDRVSAVAVDDTRSYSATFESIRNAWDDFLHEKLGAFDFQNGKPGENTPEKRPRAWFIWQLYGCDPMYVRPFYDHHCSSRERQEQMINLIDDMAEAIQGREIV